MTEKPHFVKFSSVPEGFYTKTTLRKEFGLKPASTECDATVRGYIRDKWQVFELFHIDNTIEIKKRVVKEHPLTLDNIAEALYVINKSAKVSRDTKKENYQYRNFRVVAYSKSRETKLYNLKGQVIELLMTKELAEIKGYHMQKRYDGNINYLLLVAVGDFTFHMPVFSKLAKKYTLLGDIDVISAEKTRKTTLNFFESVNVLERFIEKQACEIA